MSSEDPLARARRKLARARYHIRDLEERIRTIYQTRPYSASIEPDPDAPGKYIHRVRMVEPVPEYFSDIVGDVVVNLRAALDYAARATAGKETREAAFPFAWHPSKLEEAIANRCKDVPRDIVALFRTFKPYKGGNALLHTINRMCNQDKHCTLIPTYGKIRAASLYRAVGDDDFGIRLGRTKDEIIFRAVGEGSQSDYTIHIVLQVSFSDPDQIGQDATAILDTLAGEVERVLLAIEAEAFRLKIFG